jgi:hypothetical protein
VLFVCAQRSDPVGLISRQNLARIQKSFLKERKKERKKGQIAPWVYTARVTTAIQPSR